MAIAAEAVLVLVLSQTMEEPRPIEAAPLTAVASAWAADPHICHRDPYQEDSILTNTMYRPCTLVVIVTDTGPVLVIDLAVTRMQHLSLSLLRRVRHIHHIVLALCLLVVVRLCNPLMQGPMVLRVDME